MNNQNRQWRKSTYSGSQSNCVEVASDGDAVLMRDSKLGDGSPILTFTRGEIAAWIDGCRAGEFDDLT